VDDAAKFSNERRSVKAIAAAFAAMVLVAAAGDLGVAYLYSRFQPASAARG
jgi:phosphoheptose isomerase